MKGGKVCGNDTPCPTAPPPRLPPRGDYVTVRGESRWRCCRARRIVSADLRHPTPEIPHGLFPAFIHQLATSCDCCLWNHSLGHTISANTVDMPVISCSHESYLFRRHKTTLVGDHRSTWGVNLEAIAGTPLENHPVFVTMRWRHEGPWRNAPFNNRNVIYLFPSSRK